MNIYYLNSNNLTEEQLKKNYLNAEKHRQIRYDSTSDPLSKRECIASDMLIKYGVKCCISDCSVDVHTKYLESGKLIFVNIPLSLCISHTHGHVFLVLDKSNVGIDAEYIRDIDYKKLHNRFFANQKVTPKNNIDFFKEWTSLEAQFKCENKNILAFDNSYSTPTYSFVYKNFVLSIAGENIETDSDITVSEVYTEEL